jgi:hypothetical protein
MRRIKQVSQAWTSGTMLVIAAMLPPQTHGGDASPLGAVEFEKLHRELQPPKDELWRSIPWHVSILEGREQAAKDRKPIFVWVASGEPLGCG